MILPKYDHLLPQIFSQLCPITYASNFISIVLNHFCPEIHLNCAQIFS